jgi:tetratricopeptide (TPR) repeat protein
MQRKFLDEKDPRLVESLRRFCQLLLSEDADAEAEKVAREIIRIDPRATSALVEVLAQQHRYAEAESVYRQLLTSTEQENGADHVRTRQTLMGLAQVLDAEDKLPEAEAMYRRGLELSQRLRFTDDPTYICMELNLGDVLREQGKIDDANVHYRRGLKCAVTHPSRQHLPIRLAEILRAQGLATEADAALRHLIATFTEAIRAEPKITQLWIGRAMCYRALAEYTEAVADCTKAVELEPGDWATWSHRASVYALSGHPELAEADIAKAMEHADQNAVAYNDLAWIMAAEPSLFARNPK